MNIIMNFSFDLIWLRSCFLTTSLLFPHYFTLRKQIKGTEINLCAISIRKLLLLTRSKSRNLPLPSLR